MEWTRGFSRLSRADLALAGGKGANLGEMARAGLPVPPGFVLLTPAYQAFVQANNLQGHIEQLATGVRPDDTSAVEEASQAIRALFDAGAGAMPNAITEAVADAYGEMGGGPVAVRSSATAEDLPGASFAGQQETYLNIVGTEAVLQAVLRCWSSLWTPRAISYRARQGIAPGDVALAVVIQQLVEAEAAGVLFTANPVNGRRDQMVIDGAWGLGESVVSGQVTPDHWVATAATGVIVEERIADKQVWTVRGEAGSETRPLPPDRRGVSCLTRSQVAALVDLGRQVAAHYGEPQDMEWALEDGRLHLVQARPITSLFPMPEPTGAAGFRVYASLNSLQGLTEPFTPAGIEVFKRVSAGAARILWRLDVPTGSGAPALRTAAGRIYLEVTAPLRNRKLRGPLLAMTGALDGPLSDCLRALVERDDRLSVVTDRIPLRPPIGAMLPNLARVVAGLFFPRPILRVSLELVERDIARLEAEAGSLSTLEERVRFLERVVPTFHILIVSKCFGAIGQGLAVRFLAAAKVKEWLGDTAPLNPVLRSLPHNPTTEMDLDLWRVSRKLKAEGAEPSASHPAVQAFLARYGHRAVREIDAGMPRWSENPELVLSMLRTHMAMDESADPVRHFEAGVLEAERGAAELVQRVRRENGLLRAWAMRILLNRVRLLAGVREYPKFFFVKLPALVRRVLGPAGAELAAAGRLERPDDIYFLEFGELLGDRDLKALAAARRAEYRAELARRAVPRVITSEGETFYNSPVLDPNALGGIAASPGVYEGTVRVIRDPVGAKLEPGEILVAPGTDPAWTPLFLTAGALVMEIGGPMSHGSVVAREYGIPAVVGVAGATHRLKTGQRVRVDGETGQVIPVLPPPPAE